MSKRSQGSAAGLRLRDYQDECIRALAADWAGGTRRLAGVLPTGAGKTVIFARLVAMAAEAGKTSLVLAHRDELLDQAIRKLRGAAPGIAVGKLKAGRWEVPGRQAVVASVQSLVREKSRQRLFKNFRPGLVVVDECHHATANTYMSILEDVGAFSGPGADGPLVAGFTATLARSDRVSLGQVWQKVSHRTQIVDLIRRRYLVTARGIRVKIDGLDLRRVARTGGDWQGRALGQALSECMAPKALTRAYVEHAADRQGIVFVPSVAFAHELAPVLAEAGISSVALDGTTSAEERALWLKRYEAGEVQTLVNCGLFTEGTDLPMTKAIMIARLTSSAPLYVQMVGRGLRTWPKKRDCLVLDAAGVTDRHRIASLVDLLGGESAQGLTEQERAEMADLADELGLDLLAMDDKVESRSLPDPSQVDGRIVSEEVDLFEDSHQAWLRTYRGVWFLAAGDRVVAIVPEGGTHSVMSVPMDRAGGEWVVRDVDLSYAMSWGEQKVNEIHNVLTRGFSISKKAGWRNSGEPSPQQIALCQRLGLTVDPGWNKGDASDAISIFKASRRLDHLPIFAGVGS